MFALQGRRLVLGLMDGPGSWWLHEIRQGIRLAERSRAGNRCRDMSGIETTAGVDKIATIIALNSTKVPPEQKNNLGELFVVASGHKKKQFDCHRAHSPKCCLLVKNLKTHMLWRCQQWDTLRRER